MQNMGTDAATSSSLPPGIAAAKPNNVVDEDILLSGKNPSQLQEKPNEECSSYTSSNRESWGRCSSLGSNDESTVDYTIANGNSQMAPELLVTHGLHPQLKSLEPHIEKKKQKQKKVSTAKKSRHERFEALSQRLRLGILKRVGHRRNQSS